MRISLVIPTRERADLLAASLETARAVRHADFEIVVSDNVSADRTGEVLAAAAADPRLAVTRPARRLTMRGNFETGLDRATGDYALFIGDDDGVLAHGIDMLAAVLAREPAEAAAWPLITYVWPFAAPGHARGTIAMKFNTLYGQVRREPGPALLDRLLAGRIRNYRDAAIVYHGCVSMRLVDRVRSAQGGMYFRGMSPDVYAAVANPAHMTGPLLRIGHPVSFGGISERSQGGNTMSRARRFAPGEAEMRRFREEIAEERWSHGLDIRTASPESVTFDMLHLAVAGTGLEGRLDWRAWMAKCLGRIADLPRPEHDAQLAILRDYCARHGQEAAIAAAEARHPPRGPAEAAAPPEPAPRGPSRLRADRVRLADPHALATVADAARVLDGLIGPYRPGWLGRAVRLPGFFWRAWALVRSWGSGGRGQRGPRRAP